MNLFYLIAMLLIIFDLNMANSNKIVFKLRRTDNYKLLYNGNCTTSFYIKKQLLHVVQQIVVQEQIFIKLV